jgi:hypothetical protein
MEDRLATVAARDEVIPTAIDLASSPCLGGFYGLSAALVNKNRRIAGLSPFRSGVTII